MQKESAEIMADLGYFYAALQEKEKGKYYSHEAVRIAEKVGEERLLIITNIYSCTNLIYTEKNYDKVRKTVNKYLPLAQKYKMLKEVMWANHSYADTFLLRDQYVEGEKNYIKAVKACIQFGDIFQVTGDLAGLAMSLSGQGRYAKCMILYGAVQSKLEDLGIPKFAPVWDEYFEKHIGKAQKSLGEEKSIKLFEQGKKMGFEKAVEYALDFDKD
jgi:hypothetical protein